MIAVIFGGAVIGGFFLGYGLGYVGGRHDERKASRKLKL